MTAKPAEPDHPKMPCFGTIPRCCQIVDNGFSHGVPSLETMNNRSSIERAPPVTCGACEND